MAQAATTLGDGAARPAATAGGASLAADGRGGARVRAMAATVAGLGPLGDEVREITLPLRHEDIIRQQAADKGSTPP